MSSKYCPNCDRIVTITGSTPPNYCAWGCGTLANQPVLPKFATWAEREKVLQDARDKAKPVGQLSLFG